MSPSSAYRSIISTYSQNQNDLISPVTPKRNSRVRPERQFGEVITSGTLVQDLREKAKAKANKLSKQTSAQQPQRSTKKNVIGFF
jgi:hypothetical protein